VKWFNSGIPVSDEHLLVHTLSFLSALCASVVNPDFLTFHACRAAAGDVHEFVKRDLAGVAAGAHEQRAVGDAQVDAFLRRAASEEAVREAGCKAITAADTVFDFEIGVRWAVVKRAVVPHD